MYLQKLKNFLITHKNIGNVVEKQILQVTDYETKTSFCTYWAIFFLDK
jgi:hypothetical protein